MAYKGRLKERTSGLLQFALAKSAQRSSSASKPQQSMTDCQVLSAHQNTQNPSTMKLPHGRNLDSFFQPYTATGPAQAWEPEGTSLRRRHRLWCGLRSGRLTRSFLYQPRHLWSSGTVRRSPSSQKIVDPNSQDQNPSDNETPKPSNLKLLIAQIPQP